MEKAKIEVNLREKIGKEGAGQTRRGGDIPAIVYGKDINTPITVPFVSVKALKSINFSESTIIDMKIIGGKAKKPLP